MLQAGIVGLPNVGKSTLFNALTASGVAAENYPFCTVEPNVGMVEVPDARLDVVQELSGSAEVVPATVRFVDIAGLVRGASTGEGLGNQFLAQIREVDALLHVVRCFADSEVTHVAGSVDPARDRGVVDTELLLADLEAVGRRVEKVEKKARSGEKIARVELEHLRVLEDLLDQGAPLRAADLSPGTEEVARKLQLLTVKPVLYIANVDEAEAGEGGFSEERYGFEPGARVVPLALSLEAELAALSEEERAEFSAELGLGRDGTQRVIRATYDVLGLITFYSANEKQATAWPIPRGTKAPEAAGTIHTDFQQGFIRAETIAYEVFADAGSMKSARDQGWVRSEGKDYVVEDGDVILFRFNL